MLSGTATFTLGDETHDVPTGSLVYVADPNVLRHAVAAAPGTTVLAVGGKPGEAFQPSAWEHYFEAGAIAAQGDLERAYDLTMTGLAEHPGHPGLLYNAACYRALGGRADEAIELLRQAYTADPDHVREWAASDSDLDSLRERPDWPVAAA